MLINQYKSVFETVLLYWRAYGGPRELVQSPYFHLAIILAALSMPYWLSTGKVDEKILQVMPNIVGFSIGAFALVFAVGSDTLRALLTKTDKEKSQPPIEIMAATFVHVIVIQTLALFVAGLHGPLASLAALTFPLTWVKVLRPSYLFLGATLLFYSVALIGAAAFAIYRVVRISVVVGSGEDPS